MLLVFGTMLCSSALGSCAASAYTVSFLKLKMLVINNDHNSFLSVTECAHLLRMQ